MPEIILKVESLVKRFGGLTALDHLNMDVEEGSIHAVIGPNGSGKTTLFNVITGLYNPDAGKVITAERVLTGLAPHEIAWLGLSRTFQTLFLFREMTVLENVLVGTQCRSDYSLWKNLLLVKEKNRINTERLQKSLELLEFVGIEKEQNQLARNLPYGKQRLLEIARALGTSPKIVLLDEPAAGMNPQETMALVQTVRDIRDKLGITVLIIEHNMRLVMNLAEKATVLDYGAKIAEGSPRDINCDPKVIEAYLGLQGLRQRKIRAGGEPSGV